MDAKTRLDVGNSGRKGKAAYEAIPEGSFAPDISRNALYQLEGPAITHFACEGCHDIGKLQIISPVGALAGIGFAVSSNTVQLGTAQIPLGGDVLAAVNGTPVTTSQELIVYLESETQVGDNVEVTLIRDGREMVVTVTLAERPAQR